MNRNVMEKRNLVFDFPLRVFHWSFASTLVGAFIIANYVDSESRWYPVHMLLGLLSFFTLLLRLVWGVVGTQYSKFSQFSVSFFKLWRYFANVFRGVHEISAGHNPASSWVGALLMIVCAVMTATGIFMTRGVEVENLEEVHELGSKALLVLVILHVVGIVVHTVQLRDPIGFSMIDGKKAGVSREAQISDPKLVMSILFMVSIAAMAAFLFYQFNFNTGVLDLFGTELQLVRFEDSVNPN